jgi:hypothetical protein
VVATESKLIKLGNALARAMGHAQSCPKHHPSIPCQCGAGAQQAEALANWEALMDQIKYLDNLMHQ